LIKGGQNWTDEGDASEQIDRKVDDHIRIHRAKLLKTTINVFSKLWEFRGGVLHLGQRKTKMVIGRSIPATILPQDMTIAQLEHHQTGLQAYT
jgi:hypothetical protein